MLAVEQRQLDRINGQADERRWPGVDAVVIESGRDHQDFSRRDRIAPCLENAIAGEEGSDGQFGATEHAGGSDGNGE